MKESDWKIFKKIKADALEKFCQNAIDEFKSSLSDSTKINYEKYLHHYKLVSNTDKKIDPYHEKRTAQEASFL